MLPTVLCSSTQPCAMSERLPLIWPKQYHLYEWQFPFSLLRTSPNCDQVSDQGPGTRRLGGPPRELGAPADGSPNWGGQALPRWSQFCIHSTHFTMRSRVAALSLCVFCVCFSLHCVLCCCGMVGWVSWDGGRTPTAPPSFSALTLLVGSSGL